jgi:hypothetical protein
LNSSLPISILRILLPYSSLTVTTHQPEVPELAPQIHREVIVLDQFLQREEQYGPEQSS